MAVIRIAGTSAIAAADQFTPDAGIEFGAGFLARPAMPEIEVKRLAWARTRSLVDVQRHSRPETRAQVVDVAAERFQLFESAPLSKFAAPYFVEQRRDRLAERQG
jgi:hypothetical protein